MSVNLLKNNDALVAAWTNVVDDKSPINWAIYGYEGQTNNLKVVCTGEAGLEEMIEELDCGEIMYAFCRVIDTKTSLPKCVLVNWQGEGAPIVRKGTCANHIRDIERLLKGAHITINARSEEDVEVDIIMESLARATGSAYKFREPRGKDIGNTEVVGTTYKRVIPEQEINATERDQFWQKEEIEEKARVAEERHRLERERKRLELETRSREEQQSKLREQHQHQEQQNSNICVVNQRAQEIKNLRNHQNESDSDDEHKNRSEELRRQRSNEAQQLIAQRTINARAVFEQNSAAGQMKMHSNSGTIQKVIPREELPKVVELPKPIEPMPEVKVPLQPNSPEPSSVSEIPQAPELIIDTPEITQNVVSEVPPEIENSVEAALYNELKDDQQSYLYFDPTNEGMIARALYDYQAADDTEITFDPGDIITHIDAIDEGWWQGLGPDGTYGLFPANYVEVIDDTNT